MSNVKCQRSIRLNFCRSVPPELLRSFSILNVVGLNIQLICLACLFNTKGSSLLHKKKKIFIPKLNWMNMKVCEECGEEFCSGTCIIFQYDSYQVFDDLFQLVRKNCSKLPPRQCPTSKPIHFLQRLLKEEDEDGGEEEEAKKKKKRGKSAKKKKGEEKSAKKA